MRFSHVIICVFICLLTCALTAQAGSYPSTEQPTDIRLVSAAQVSLAQESILPVEQVVELPRGQWQDVTDHHIHIQPESNWLKLEIHNASDNHNSAFLTIGNEFALRMVAIYHQEVSGDISRLSQELLATNRWSTQIVMSPDEYKTVYVELVADTELQLPVAVEDANYFASELSSTQYQNGFAIGGITFVAIMLLLLFIGVRDATLSFLSAYFFTRAALLSVLVGGHTYFLFPSHPELRGAELPLLVALSTSLFLWFTVYFFQLKKNLPIAIKVAKVSSLLLFVFMVASFYLPVNINMILSGGIASIMLIVLAVLGLYLHRQKHQRLALLFSIIMVIQFVFTQIILLGVFFDVSVFQHREPLQITSFMFNTVLVVFLICRQYYYQVKDKQKAQKEALTNALASKKANEQLLRMQEENQEDLEQRVQERTLELNIALTELEELNRELEQKNTIDELTGLYNRRFYDQRILAEYRRSKRNLTPLSLVIIDLDFFKQVNDQHGHLAGDQCLSWLAQHIKQSLKRSTDVGCRYGGEEFCLILPDTDVQGAIALADELRVAVESFDFVYQGQHLSLTVSCGVATYVQQDNIDPAHIFCAADKALYQAKRGGRNQVQIQELSPDLLLQEHSND